MKKIRIILFLLPLFLGLSACVPTEIRPVSEWSVFNRTAAAPTARQTEFPAAGSHGAAVACTVFDGQAQFPSGWFPLQKAEFKIRRGETGSFTLRSKKNEIRAIYVRFDPDGQKMVFCPETEEAGRGTRIPCYSIYALEDDFDAGIKRTFDVPKAVRGSEMTCKTRAP